MPDLIRPDGSPYTVIGYDIETHRIVPGRLVPRLVCLSLDGEGPVPQAVVDVAAAHPKDAILRDTTDGWSALFGRVPAMSAFAELLQDPDVILVAHNAPFDLSGLAEATHTEALRTRGGLVGSLITSRHHATVFDALDVDPPKPCAKLVCTKIRETLIAIGTDRLKFDGRTGMKAPSFSLAYLVDVYFGIDISGVKAKKGCTCQTTNEAAPFPLEPCPDCGSWRLLYHRLDGVPVTDWPEAAVEYAIEDAMWARRVVWAQAHPLLSDANSPIVLDSGAVVDEDPQLRAGFALHLMAAHGPRTDRAAVDAWEAELVEAVAEIDAAGQRAGFVRENGTKDMKTLRALVADAYKGDPPTTEKGAVKTDRDTLLGSAHPDLIAFADPDANRKNLTTYVPTLRRGDTTPITSSPNVLVSSGRCSWRNPSLHQPPRKGGFRECFTARPGRLFASVDYDTIELKALAQIQLWWFGRSAMADALIRGEDLHLSLGAQLLGLSYDDALAAYKNEAHPDHKRVSEARQTAKIANFGFPGGLSAETFVDYARSQDVILSPERANEIRDAWLERWVEMSDYFDVIGNAGRWDSFTAVQCVSNRNRAGCTFTSGCNTYFQGLVADGVKAATWEVSRLAYTDMMSDMYGVRPWLMLHDEIIAEGPEHSVTRWADAMASVMRETMQRYLPDIPVTCEPAAMRRWHKSAKTVRDEHGALIPWEPSPRPRLEAA